MYSKKTQIKSNNRKRFIKKLDAIVTKIVVLRDSFCVTCGVDDGIYCGHYHSRKHYATRWDLMNCHAQCNPCNHRHEHDPYPYTQFMLDKYGREECDRLYALHRQVTHYKSGDLEKKYDELKAILKDLLVNQV